jgi:7,8-dihydropterin-6-yl-methyl-4-(beta-D-ribofuranosyl)aminobenzene 5'-phosphate synthase
LKLTVLVDNNTLIDHYFYAEPAVSYLIEDRDIRILFDVGYSDVFLKNAQKMRVDLLSIDFIVLSHGHLDHTWGLFTLLKLYTDAGFEKISYKIPTLIAHPHAFLTRTMNDLKEIGSIISKEKLENHFKLELSKDPVWLTDDLVFLGEIERKTNFEANIPIGKILGSSIKDDYLIDDSALVYKSKRGLVIITGCSHSGICNIAEYAKKICDDDRIIDIIGGFHLISPSDEQLEGTLQYMGKLMPEKVHACHCTDLNSKIALSKVVKLEEVGVGLVIKHN